MPGAEAVAYIKLKCADNTWNSGTGGYYVSGARVSLDSIAHGFNRGQSPEAIQEDFPTLTRAQVYGAIAFYLDNQDEIDEYLAASAREFEGGRFRWLKKIPHCGRDCRGRRPG
jgi:uncharacterized protein (DUF433 family)